MQIQESKGEGEGDGGILTDYVQCVNLRKKPISGLGRGLIGPNGLRRAQLDSFPGHRTKGSEQDRS